jgi:hypothetical protein
LVTKTEKGIKMNFLIIGLIRLIYLAITVIPALFLFCLYTAGNGDPEKFLNKWFTPVLFGEDYFRKD